MNEQIEKLAEQAFSFASAADDSDESDANWWEKYNEKFAELIVKECAEICDQQGRVGWNDDRKAQASLDRDLIKEHFGVK